MDSQQISQDRPHLFYHFIQSEAIPSTISLTSISFFTTSTNVIFNLPYLFPQLESTHSFSPLHYLQSYE